MTRRTPVLTKLTHVPHTSPMTQNKLTEAQADALRWVHFNGTLAAPRADVIGRVITAGLVETVPGRMVNGKPSNLALTSAGEDALAEADAIEAAPFRIRAGAR